MGNQVSQVVAQVPAVMSDSGSPWVSHDCSTTEGGAYRNEVPHSLVIREIGKLATVVAQSAFQRVPPGNHELFRRPANSERFDYQKHVMSAR